MTARSPAAAPGKPRTYNKGLELPPEILTPDELTRLLLTPSRHAPTGIRNRALLAVMARAGLRCAEALALEKRDVDLDQRTLRIRHGKGDKRRTVGMIEPAPAFLERWLDYRTQLKLPGRLVFCTLDGRPLHSSYVRTLVPRLARKADIPKRVHPHGLRHTFAAFLAANGVPANEIQEWLGHSSLHTTSIYLKHITPANLVARARALDDWWAEGSSG